MTLELLLTLGGLALVDSLSIGTLLVPVFFLIAPRLRVGRMLLYLATIAGFYLVVGIVLMLGAQAAFTALGDIVDSTAGRVVQLALGVGLLVTSFLIPTKPKEGAGPGRLSRWRNGALEGRRASVVMVVAIGAGLVEVTTMLPYLGAIGLMTAAPITVPTRALLLLVYCGVMVLPALVLLAARLVARRLIEPGLRRLAAWLERTGAETTAWIIGIVGFLIARDAAAQLELFAGLG